MIMRAMKKWMYGVAFFFVFAQSLMGESKKLEVASELPAYISWSAIGAQPARRFKISRKGRRDKRDDDSTGIPIPLNPKSGSVPPSSLFFKEGRDWKRVSLGFDRFSHTFSVPSGQSLTFYRKVTSEQTVDYKQYFKISKLPRGSQWLVFLTRQGKGNWNKEPSVSMLRLDSKALKHKNVLFRNVSSYPVSFRLENKSRYVIHPSRRMSFKISSSKERGLCRVFAEMGEKKKIRLLNSSMRVSDHFLTVIVFYDENRSGPASKKVGVTRMVVPRLSAKGLQGFDKKVFEKKELKKN